MRNTLRLGTSLVLMALLISSLNIIPVTGSSETQATTAQASPPFFDITILDDELVNKSVQSLAFDPINNQLFVGTSQGLSVVEIDNLTITNITQGDGLVGYNIHALALDCNRQLVYIGFFGGYGINTYNWSSGELNSFYPENCPSVIGIHDLIYEPISDCLFIGSDPDGLYIHNFTTDTTISRNTTHGLPSNQIRSLELDVDRDILYVGTHGGLAIYNITNDSFDVRAIDDGLIDNLVYDLELDEIAENLYIGTLANSLSIYDIKNDLFSNIDVIDYTYGIYGLGDFTHDMLNNRMYIGGGWEGLYVYDTQDNIFTNRYTESEGIPTGVRQLVWSMELNTLFVGTNEEGLAICKITHLPTPILYDLPEHDYDGKYVVSWQPSVNATYYTLQESADSTFTSAKTIFSGNSIAFTISNQSDGIFYYRIRASNTTSNSPWSNIEHIQVINPPVEPLFNPLNSPNTDGNYTLTWSNVTSADYYELEESQDVDFTATVQIYSGPNATYTITDRPDGAFHYRVRSVNAAGNSSWNFTAVVVIHPPGTPAFDQVSGMNNTGNFSLSWSALPTADYYELEECTSSDFALPVLVYNGSDVFANIVNRTDGDYYYRVRAKNDGGNGSWSQSLIMTVLHPPTVPVLSLNETDSNTTLTWTQVQNVDYYVLEIADNPEFTGVSAIYNGSGNSFLANETGTHYYRVKAGNAGGESDWSNVVAVSISPPSSDFLFFIGAGIIIIVITSVLIWQIFRKSKLEHSEKESSNNNSVKENRKEGRVKE